ncbi:MAG TPA: hypothetical protein PKD49_02135 [Hyphomicrobium sp.]|nr:hypothetical protein [Hyphomicrobium sp.]
MMRPVLQFFSMLALGVMTLGVLTLTIPWLNTQGEQAASAGAGLHMESAVLGLAIGLALGILSRYHWTDIPRRVVAWFLVRERQFFYYAVIAGCVGVLVFY